MAELPNLTNRLLVRLPGRSSAELEGWVNESALQHGYAAVADVPDKAVNAILAYAEYIGLKAKAAETADNASITVKGMSFTKTVSSGNFNALVKEAWNQYRREAARAGIRAIGGNVISLSLTRPDGR